MSEIPWPKLDDELFTDEGDNSRTLACLGFAFDQWYGYYAGYKDAADLLVDLLEEGRGRQDVLVYPVIFLYRHAIELSLKNVLRLARDAADERSAKSRPNHQLVPIWNALKPLLARIWPGQPQDDVNAMTMLLMQFEASDPRSMTFRYPEELDGAPHHSSHQVIGLANFRRVAAGILSFLSGVGSSLDQYIESRNELRAENADLAAEMGAEQDEYEAELRADYEAEMRPEYDQY